MKKKLSKKLSLKKITVATLANESMANLKGGSIMMSNCYPECESWECPTRQMPSCKDTLCGTSCYDPCGTIPPDGTCKCV
jgi:hypothetical protein